MRLFLLVALTMTAFAANSILNRLALAEGQIGALPFAALRISSGALALALLVTLQRRRLPLTGPGRVVGALSLTLYMVGFSVAYLSLEAGVGALILFGGVQVTMFAGALWLGQPVTPRRWVGAGLAFGGLIWLLAPTGTSSPSLLHATVMAAAAVGWGIYSLVGQRVESPLPATAANFVLAVPLGILCMALLPAEGGDVPISTAGVALAITSGVVTSGLGYSLWYLVLPRLQATTAALSQLSVPVIAMAGGMIFLGEALTLRFVLASVLVLGGVAIGTAGSQRTISSKGS